MAGNGGRGGGLSSSSSSGVRNSISAVETSDDNIVVVLASSTRRFHHHHERPRRWGGGCWGGLLCFKSNKGGKRIVPASRLTEGNASANRGNGSQPVGHSNQATTISPSLLAPPSSPASFTNSALPSTAQSPNCYLSLSANSPGGPSSSMFATGPYAHETQLVSPPVFSTYTTEPSTAPFTPPPELNHFTTPSSPDVPYAQFLLSSLKTSGKSSYVNSGDLQATYPLYPESPASSLLSPISGTSGNSSFHHQEFPGRWGASISPQDSRYQSPRLFGLDTDSSKNFMLSQDSSFSYPATSAQFYLDQAQQSFLSYPHSGGRLSVSREADVHLNNGKHNKKAEVEEIEAYRASFGFSADEIITTPQYIEISDDVLDENFTMAPFASNQMMSLDESVNELMLHGEDHKQTTKMKLLDFRGPKSTSDQVLSAIHGKVKENLRNGFRGHKSEKQSGDVSESKKLEDHAMTDEEDIFSMIGSCKTSKRYCRLGSSNSDAEIDYRRGKGDFTAWRE